MSILWNIEYLRINSKAAMGCLDAGSPSSKQAACSRALLLYSVQSRIRGLVPSFDCVPYN